MSSRFQRFLLPGFAFKAVVIGGGYATGRELAEFFLPSGPWGGIAAMVLAMSDPGEKDLNGGVVYTRYGKGTYIYTGLAFFRELPDGVPGAYRLFVNLLSASKTE